MYIYYLCMLIHSVSGYSHVFLLYTEDMWLHAGDGRAPIAYNNIIISIIYCQIQHLFPFSVQLIILLIIIIMCKGAIEFH